VPVRLVATDLDGTFLRHDGTPHPRVLDALERVLNAGIHVAFVTGRPTRWLTPVIEASGHRGTAVCSNGAVLVDLHEERVLEVAPVPAEQAREAVNRLRRLDPETAFAFDIAHVGDLMGNPSQSPGFFYDLRYEPYWAPTGANQVPDITEHLHRGSIAKLLARPSDRTAHNGADYWLDASREVLAGVVEVTHSTKGDVLMEMSADGVTKASGLATLSQRIGVTADEVLAVGDMPNDLPMLAWAGRGFAVANAHRTVLSAVHDHVPSNDDGGVADVLLTALDG
jgi:hydroxymethylpyrimidine pyrophosphatase-like HAD family hydrolase